MRRTCRLYLTAFTLILGITTRGQDSLRNTPLTLDSACRLAVQNSIRLKLSRTGTQLAKQQTEVARLDALPGLSTSFTYGYLSNADVWDPGLDHHVKAGLPHLLTLFSVQASETLFAGGRINNAIRLSSLQEQIAFLRLEKNTTDIKFLAIAAYLDIIASRYWPSAESALNLWLRIPIC